MDKVRVLRIIEYVGPRDKVEDVVANSIQGEKRIPGIGLVIRAATIGSYPEILETNELYIKALERDQLILRSLQSYGVDNWEGYEMAMDAFEKEQENG